jgi:hypothetical protein
MTSAACRAGEKLMRDKEEGPGVMSCLPGLGEEAGQEQRRRRSAPESFFGARLFALAAARAQIAAGWRKLTRAVIVSLPVHSSGGDCGRDGLGHAGHAGVVKRLACYLQT